MQSDRGLHQDFWSCSRRRHHAFASAPSHSRKNRSRDGFSKTSLAYKISAFVPFLIPCVRIKLTPTVRGSVVKPPTPGIVFRHAAHGVLGLIGLYGGATVPGVEQFLKAAVLRWTWGEASVEEADGPTACEVNLDIKSMSERCCRPKRCEVWWK